MKKYFLIISLLLMALFTIGCEPENEATADLTDATYSAEAEEQQLRGEIDDIAFWNSLDRATDMIKHSLEANRDVSVGFRLETTDGDTIFLEDAYVFELAYINDEWRDLTASQITYIVATADQVTKVFDRGESVQVTGVIMKWVEYVGSDRTPRNISVCDFEGDGQWNCAAEGKMFFTDEIISDIPGARNEFGNIGITIVRNTTSFVTLTAFVDTSLSTIAELVLQAQG